MEALREQLYNILADDPPMTVRQVYYQMVSRGAIEKTENGYKAICRLLANQRRAEVIPYEWVVDNTRWIRKPKTHSSLDRMLAETVATYRRSVWDAQEANVEIWLEKDALAGVLYDVTARWDVPLMVTRGFSSLSFTFSAAQAFRAIDKPTFVYYFGDYDPAGLKISRSLERQLRAFAPAVDLTFERVAVTREQIESLHLPTRPTKNKRSTDDGRSVEVDAIPSRTLRNMAEECITQHIDAHAYYAMQRAEEAERRSLQTVAANWRLAGGAA